MSNFDEWHWNYGDPLHSSEVPKVKKAFEAGQQSRQAKIDSLKVELDAANERALMLLDHKNKMADKLQGKINELQEMHIQQDLTIAKLQKRIDDLKKMAFNLKTDLIRENHFEYDKGWKDCATSFYHEILKGESK